MLCSAAIIETMRDCMSVKVHRAVLQAAATWCPPPGAFQSLRPAQLGRRRLCTYKAPLHPSRSMPTSTRSWQHLLARRCRRLQCRSSCTPGQPPCRRSPPSISLLSRLQASLHSRPGVYLLTPQACCLFSMTGVMLPGWGHAQASTMQWHAYGVNVNFWVLAGLFGQNQQPQQHVLAALQKQAELLMAQHKNSTIAGIAAAAQSRPSSAQPGQAGHGNAQSGQAVAQHAAQPAGQVQQLGAGLVSQQLLQQQMSQLAQQYRQGQAMPPASVQQNKPP